MNSTNEKVLNNFALAFLVVVYAIVCLLCGFLLGWGIHQKETISRLEMSIMDYQMGEAEAQDRYSELLASYDELVEQQTKLGEQLSLEYVGEFHTTAYCTEKRKHICGEGHGITASGQPIQAGVTVAADPKIFPYGTILYIEDVGIRIVQDKGAAIKDKHLDVAVDTHANALKWSGYGEHKVYVVHVGGDSNV